MKEKLNLITNTLGKPKDPISNLKRVEFVKAHIEMALEEFHELVLENEDLL